MGTEVHKKINFCVVFFQKAELLLFFRILSWDEKKVKIKTNRNFWIPKIERNMQRDEINNQLLSSEGWCVMRIWEHEVKKEFDICINRIISYLENFIQTQKINE